MRDEQDSASNASASSLGENLRRATQLEPQRGVLGIAVYGYTNHFCQRAEVRMSKALTHNDTTIEGEQM